MPKQRLPQTSIDAYHQMPEDVKQKHWDTIKSTLRKIGSANSNTIALHSGLDRHAVGRRMKELVNDEKSGVYLDGKKSNTRSGREALNYSIAEIKPVVEPVYEKSIPGESVSDFSKKLIRKTYTQADIFHNANAVS